ncbi:uncharacterized protein EV420DRAFT_1539084 [Desarmillaria tabescens]|uniref:FAD-binding PCMH-type domain-containing protein n=1 Tax=Armillaria tabescens TaxID=1929756 RepID=A0AA39KEB8_ARMTA|nr:uncharacterized protein EV420DRAFT_1539084 [Desarmillaria tabescens]KAK0459233.1 hypothetical protein EV420DRAFT_1539084 [Desarmillaria tabescens]
MTDFNSNSKEAEPVIVSPLPKHLYEELNASLKGQVFIRGNPHFVEYTTMFNGNVKTLAKAVVCPVDAEDVSTVMLFCLKHSLSPSIKAGGYGTAGWAVGGDVVLDMSRIVDIDIEVPNPELPGGYTSLEDMKPSTNNKGKQPATGKRRREEDASLRSYHLASEAVANFLEGPSSNRRRTNLDGDSVSPPLAPGPASPVVILPTPSNGPVPVPGTSQAPVDADPFGYLNPSQVVLPPDVKVSSSYSTWTETAAAAPFSGGSNLPPAQLNILSPPEPVHSHAFVTFGAGMRQKEIDMYTAAHPLEATSLSGKNDGIPYHVPFAAHPVGSSIMLLGGFGFLSRLHGLSVDNLVEVEMVLANGKIVVVNETSHPDLWWAVRGAGPAFGIATRYKARAYPVPVVFAGNLIYRFKKATAPSLLKHFRDCVKGAPRELYANVLLTAGPEGKASLVVIQMCYVGTKEKGQEYLAAISSWTGDTCLLNEVDEKSFLHQQDSVAQVLRGKAGRQWFIRSALITSLPDDIIHETVLNFSDTPDGCTWLFELTGGRISDIEDSCLPKEQREAAFTIAALHQWDMDVQDDRCEESAEEWIGGTLKPVHRGGPFPSFLGRHEAPERTIACYGDKNFARLKEIKKKYDPDNVFRNCLWPVDAEGTMVEARLQEPPTP